MVNDRRASLDEDTEIRPAMRTVIQAEFEKGASIPRAWFPANGEAIQDTPKLTLVVMDPEVEWTGAATDSVRERIAEWTRHRGKSPRLYPGSLIWALRKPGRELRDKVELWPAWKRVAAELAEGTLGGDFDAADRADIRSKEKEAKENAQEEVWGGYRYLVVADASEPDGLTTIDLGAGHSSSGESLCGRVLSTLKSRALLNESVGAGYLERNWPPALREAGAWPLASLRQSFLNGSLTRLVDPDTLLRRKIVEFVGKGEFGLASGKHPDGGYGRLWFEESVGSEEVAFESDVYLLLGATAKALKAPPEAGPAPQPGAEPGPAVHPLPEPRQMSQPEPGETTTLRILGDIPPEIWNRLGTKLLPKLRSGRELKVGLACQVTVDASAAEVLAGELHQTLKDLGLADRVRIERD